MSDFASVSFFNNKFYLGAHDGARGDWDYTRDHYEVLAKLNPAKSIAEGRIIPVAYERWRQAERSYAKGDISATSLNNITVIQLLDEVIRRQWRDFFAIQGVRKIPVPKLQLDVAITDKYTENREVPELVAPDVSTNIFTQANLRLFKNMTNLYESDESRLKATIEPLDFEIEQASGALANAANAQIITQVEAATDRSNGSDWSAINGTHGRNSNNPLAGLTTDLVTLVSNHFRPNTLLLHPVNASEYLTSTFIQGQEAALDRQGPGVWPLPKMPGITAIADVGVTLGTAVLYDKSAMLFGEGPTVAEQYRDHQRGADGYVIRQWIHPLRATNDAFARQTGL